ncbi:MAG: twin-arginine translocase TatA/TatE family subunit [Myxococcales bacterium]|jgi:sec-independent protein translocase protein TatA|nr:twin-arginine translocase TatA/TatE family subunit [Myxococcales bacterium]HRC56149.1 twin-arginine translocase TatA/TatE family subunit [Kofleriaceae bacterium]
MPGMGELLIIMAIVLLIFGAGKLPQIGDALGRSIKNFKRASNADDEIEVKKRSELESKRAAGALEPGEDPEEAEIVSKRKSVKKEA